MPDGDLLTKRTVNEPKNRPKIGTAPFAWEASAEDALIYDKVNQWSDWTIPGQSGRRTVYTSMSY